jgi:lipoprotein-releasing system permease protein
VTNDWIETNRSLFEALRLEQVAIALTIGLVVVVAALNIVATLIIMVRSVNIPYSSLGATSKSAGSSCGRGRSLGSRGR